MKSFAHYALAAAVMACVISTARAGDTAGQAEVLITKAVSAQRMQLAPNAPAFTADPILADIARSRAQAMANGSAPLGHQDAKGNYPAYDAVRARFAPFDGTLGENIAVGNGSDSTDANEMATDTISHWMASPGHRGNILSAGFNRIGVGVAIHGDTAYAVAVFTGPHAAR